MRLVKVLGEGDFCLTDNLPDKDVPPYAILSHTWGDQHEEVSYADMLQDSKRHKPGFRKLRFCGTQAVKDGLGHFWVDSCCINRASDAELSESLNSMYRWYQQAAKCYVYLADVPGPDECADEQAWIPGFQASRWFTRGWTLQELLAPSWVLFFSRDGYLLGDKQSLRSTLCDVTGIPLSALLRLDIDGFSPTDKFRWAANRHTSRCEDWAYSLMGLFGVSMPAMYGEGRVNATRRLKAEVDMRWRRQLLETEMPYHLRDASLADRCTGAVDPCLAHAMSAVEQQNGGLCSHAHTSTQRRYTEIYSIIRNMHERLIQLEMSAKAQNVTDRCLDFERTRHFSYRTMPCKHIGAEQDTFDQQTDASGKLPMRPGSDFLEGNPEVILERLGRAFNGPPKSQFEGNPSFLPQTYTVEGLFSRPLFVLAVKQRYQHSRLTQQFYMLYAQTPFVWRRIVVSATYQDASAISPIADGDDEFIAKPMPKVIESFVITTLSKDQLFYSATRVSVLVGEGICGVGSPKVLDHEISEDLNENKMSSQLDFVQALPFLRALWISESDVEVTSQVNCSCFAVRVRGQRGIERKAPFASGGRAGQNSLQGYVEDLKLLVKLQHIPAVPELLGIVFDDVTQKLKSYVIEAPLVDTHHKVYYGANAKKEKIPWPLRLLWAKQLTLAVAAVHRKGLILGVLGRYTVGIRADGSLVLSFIRQSALRLADTPEQIPPELETAQSHHSQSPLNESTDIFQMALLLWFMAEHRGNTRGLRCSRNACTSIPRYCCLAEHAKLECLPPCHPDVPTYFSSLITQCRSRDPSKRPSAQYLANVLAPKAILERCPPDDLARLPTYAALEGILGVHCDECGTSAGENDVFYHCYVCNAGNFDLCAYCLVTQSISCLDPAHQMTVRTYRAGRPVDLDQQAAELSSRVAQ